MINELKNYSLQSPFSYTLGMSLTMEALKGIPQEIVGIYLSQDVKDNIYLHKLLAMAKEYAIPIAYDNRLIQALSLKENCYCIAVFKKFKKTLKKAEHVVLYRYDDEGNLGTTLRSAVSFDFKNIVLIDSRLDLFSPRTVRASMGAIFHTNIVAYNDIASYLKDYPKQKLYLLANEGTELKKTQFDKPFSVLLANGEYKEMKDETFYLKKAANVSLGIEASSAIVFHELFVKR